MACTHNKSTICLLKFKEIRRNEQMSWKGYAHYTPKYSRRKKFNSLAFCFLITAETAGVDKIPSLHLKEKEILNFY